MENVVGEKKESIIRRVPFISFFLSLFSPLSFSLTSRPISCPNWPNDPSSLPHQPSWDPSPSPGPLLRSCPSKKEGGPDPLIQGPSSPSDPWRAVVTHQEREGGGFSFHSPCWPSAYRLCRKREQEGGIVRRADTAPSAHCRHKTIRKSLAHMGFAQ